MLRRHPAPVLLGHVGTVGDTQQRIMRLIHGLVGEEAFVGRHQRQRLVIGEVDQRRFEPVVFRRLVAHQFDVEAAREQRRQPAQRGLGGGHPALADEPPHGAGRAAGERDQSVSVAVQAVEIHLRRDAGLGVQIGAADQFQEVAVPGLALHQQDQLVRGRRTATAARRERPASAVAVAGCGALRMVRAADVELATDDRLHALRRRHRGELQRAEQIAAVGDRHRRHLEAPAKRHQRVQMQRPLGQRVGGMHPEMNELGVRHVRSPA